MKRVLVYLCSLLLIMGACSKKKDKPAVDQAAVDEQLIQNYIADHELQAQRDPSGLYYKIETPGTGEVPGLQSKVTVTYTGKLLDGTVFGTSEEEISFVLSGVIAGWQIGIPKIKSGGKILLLIPSALAYGTNGKGSIPPNTVLIFEVQLIGVD